MQWMRHDDMLWNGSGNARIECQGDEGTNSEDGDSDTDNGT